VLVVSTSRSQATSGPRGALIGTPTSRGSRETSSRFGPNDEEYGHIANGNDDANDADDERKYITTTTTTTSTLNYIPCREYCIRTALYTI
jgi:hypothetical protein